MLQSRQLPIRIADRASRLRFLAPHRRAAAAVTGAITRRFAFGSGAFSLEISRRNAARRAPQAFEVVKLARILAEDVDNEINVVEQHPLRLLVAFGVSGADAGTLQAL